MNPIRKKRREDGILLIGPFTPPVNGFSIITESLCCELEKRVAVKKFNTSVSNKLPLPIYHMVRMWNCIIACAQVAVWGLRGGKNVYIACNGGWGLVYSILQATATRIFSSRTYIHHHSFEYIDRDSWKIRCLVTAASVKTVHIFLCPTMRDKFCARYGDVDAIVLENSAFVPTPRFDSNVSFEGRDIVIGLLGNLNREKGLYSFLKLIKVARRQGFNVRGLLAGPAKGEDLETILLAASDPEMCLTYIGGVYGDDKEDFYRRIDLFYFPTEYRTEAQPTVIFEAQSYGIPVISRELGCIGCQLPKSKGLVSKDAEILSSSMYWLREFSNPSSFCTLRADNRAWFCLSKENALKSLDRISRDINLED